MSDYNSSLPVRTENNGDVVSKICDATVPSQQLVVDSNGKIEVKIDDAAGNGLTSQANGSQQALDVGIDVGGVQIDPRSIRALTSSDVVTADQGTAGTIGQAWFVQPTDGTNSQSYTASGEAKVSVTQPLPTGSNVIGAVTQSAGPWTQNLTQVGGSSLTLGQKTSANSIPVVLASDQSAINVNVVSSVMGTEVNSYTTTASLAAGASVNHDYAITAAKTFKGRLFWATASGKLKAEVQISPDGSTFTTKWVGFNSTANPNIPIELDNLTVSETGTGSKIRIILTNRDNQAEDVYSTISGTEV